MAGTSIWRRVQQGALALGVVAVLGLASGGVPETPFGAPAALAIHEGNEPTEFGPGPWSDGR
jgi:hypothetical protein